MIHESGSGLAVGFYSLEVGRRHQRRFFSSFSCATNGVHNVILRCYNMCFRVDLSNYCFGAACRPKGVGVSAGLPLAKAKARLLSLAVARDLRRDLGSGKDGLFFAFDVQFGRYIFVYVL